jgi:YidC/Oxa1 family membrane protein insertase
MNIFTLLLVQPLFNILFTIYAFLPGHDFGVAIIILTILVRLALWPLVNKQLHSQKILKELQPEVNKIREKAKGDRQKETQMLMELYKERGTNPFASILPLLIQLPIFFALYAVLSKSVHPDQIAKLAYDWVAALPPIQAIINHTATFSPTLFGLVNLTKPSLVLGILAGLAQYAQTKQLSPHTATSPEQAQMTNAMTLVFPFITALISLTLPSALALYWITTSLVATMQQYLVLNKDARELEEKAA